ncbi:MAG: CPBP family intramembrane metalloprotease [Lachnospiraceae bacterium]|nr:CPBP family intramembrane metalloprotease [Lachnospiraceae bacterium]
MENGTKDTDKALRGAGIFFMVMMLLEIPLSLVVSMLQMALPSRYQVLISVLCTQGYLLLGGILYIRMAGLEPGRDLRFCSYRLSTFFLSLVALVTAMPMAQWLNLFSQLFTENQAGEAITQVTQNVPVWLGIAVIGCLPGLVEETLFRGIMLQAFRRRSIWTGILISAVSFGLMHMNFNQIFYAVYLGIVFALMVEATGSIVSTMLLHMLFNGGNTAVLYLLPKYYEWMGQYSEVYTNVESVSLMENTLDTSQMLLIILGMAPFALGGIVLTVLLLKVIAKRNGREFTWSAFCQRKEPDVRPVNGPLLLGWGVCIAFSILNLLYE